MGSESVTLAEISQVDLGGHQGPLEASITNVKQLSSYNWLDKDKPTIVVPGCPSLWKEHKGSKTFTKDSGLVYIDENAARSPASPLEPLFAALFTTHPSFDIRSVDVIIDRSNIRRLLCFINPQISGMKNDPFTMGVEVVGKTAIFTRQEPAATKIIKPSEFIGFGHQFEKDYTENEIKGTTGHYEIMSYDFGSMNFVVRYEADGYVDTGAQTSGQTENDPLSEIVGSLSLASHENDPKEVAVETAVSVQQAGRMIPYNLILELKTRVFTNRLSIDDVAAQLWASQTSKLVRAYYNRGTFQEPLMEDVGGQIKRWEKQNYGELQKLAVLIRKIADVAESSGGSATVRWDGREKLVILRDSKDLKALSAGFYAKWHGTNDAKAEETPKTPSEGNSIAKASASTEDSPSHKYASYKAVQYGEIIEQAIDKGFRHFFRLIPTQLSEYRTLCNSLDELAIDVTKGCTVSDIMKDMRRGKDDYYQEYFCDIKGEKTLARDAAFRLLYLFLQNPPVDSNRAYNAGLFVVSYWGIFKGKTRKMVREALQAQFCLSWKQKQGLDKWLVSDFYDTDDDEEATTENESDDYYDSDEYYGSNYS